MLPTWDDSFSVHNEKIDEQHKKLFELANYAYICADRHISGAEIRQLLQGFFEYMNEHFQSEEAYMRSIGYPRLEAHHKIHEEIVEGFKEITKGTPNVIELKEKLGIIAKNWLLQHILQEDMLIERYRAKAEAEGTLKIIPEEIEIVVPKAPEINASKAQYTCGCEGKKHVLTPLVHKKIQDGKAFNCKICKQPLKFEKLLEAK
ncbi:MAG: hemerythrin family protein [Helicobacter sp.]|nr:hemerythrin family protein [Helicobacter sp.]